MKDALICALTRGVILRLARESPDVGFRVLTGTREIRRSAPACSRRSRQFATMGPAVPMPSFSIQVSGSAAAANARTSTGSVTERSALTSPRPQRHARVRREHVPVLLLTQCGDERVLLGHDGGKVRRLRGGPHAVEWMVPGAMLNVRGPDQRLRGDAADVDASAAERPGFDERHAGAEIRGANRCGESSGPATEHDDVGYRASGDVRPARRRRGIGCRRSENRGAVTCLLDSAEQRIRRSFGCRNLRALLWEAHCGPFDARQLRERALDRDRAVVTGHPLDGKLYQRNGRSRPRS